LGLRPAPSRRPRPRQSLPPRPPRHQSGRHGRRHSGAQTSSHRRHFGRYCGRPSDPEARRHGSSRYAEARGILRQGRLTTINGLDPTALPLTNWPTFFSLYDTLMRFDNDYKPVPQLAESWAFEDGGKRL